MALNRFYLIKLYHYTIHECRHEMGFGILRDASFKQPRKYATQWRSILRKRYAPLNQKQHFLKFFLLSISYEINTPNISRCLQDNLSIIIAKSINPLSTTIFMLMKRAKASLYTLPILNVAITLGYWRVFFQHVFYFFLK